MAIQETKIDSTIAELFPDSCLYNVYREDRNLHGNGVMLLVHNDMSHISIMELENNSESVLVKVFANKTSHHIASWYRQSGGTSIATRENTSFGVHSVKQIRSYTEQIKHSLYEFLWVLIKHDFRVRQTSQHHKHDFMETYILTTPCCISSLYAQYQSVITQPSVSRVAFLECAL